MIRPAATICLLRDAPSLEVLMVRRRAKSSFMGGTYVFPGGGVDEADRSEAAMTVVGGDAELAPWRAAAVRELAEEVGLWLGTGSAPDVFGSAGVWEALAASGTGVDPDSLVYFAHWVTPAQFEIRFEAKFFATIAPPDAAAVADEAEVFDATWVRPAAAMRRADDGEWQVPFPTRAQLEVFADFETSADLLDHLRSIHEIPRIEPRVGRDGGGEVRVLMPGEPGQTLDEVLPGTGH